jgi:hypothetical protein
MRSDYRPTTIANVNSRRTCNAGREYLVNPEKSQGDAGVNDGTSGTFKGSVILVHGIRTHADWYRDVRDTLTEDGYRVHLTNYGRFDLFRFLLPTDYFRHKVKNKIYRQLRAAIKNDASAEYSIIAHSFGTFIVSNILKDEFDIQIDKVIFAGSVVKYDFPFEQFSDRFQGEILNEVGTYDPWPVIAESVTTGYGSAGTFGFKRPPVVDRWHVGGHSHVLKAEHCREYWLPFLNNGEIKTTDASTKVPFWIRLIQFVKIKFFLLLIALYLILLAALMHAYAAQPVKIQLYPNKAIGGWSLDNGDVAKSVNSDMDQRCPVDWIPFDRGCSGWHAKLITKRSWRGVHTYDHSLNDLLFPEALVYTYRDPELFWFDLASAYPNCVLIREVDGNLKIDRDPRCNLNSKPD